MHLTNRWILACSMAIITGTLAWSCIHVKRNPVTGKVEGCTHDNSPEVVRCPCMANAECPTEKPFCDYVRCVACRSDDDCGSVKNKCSFGKCVECDYNADCANGEYCRSGRCLDGCASDSDCDEQERCNESTHRCIHSECARADDCPGTEVCRDHRCVEKDDS